MTKLTLTNVANLTNENSAVLTLNNNFAAISAAFEKTLSRDGTLPNQMGSNLDMNSNRIFNLPQALTGTEPLRFSDLVSFTHGGTISTIPAGGTSGQILTKNSSTDYDTSWKNYTSDSVTYTTPYIGGTSITQTTYNNQIIWATTFAGIDPTGVTDSGPGIRAMIGGNLPVGAVIYFPAGTYLLDSSVNDDAFGLSQTAVRDNPISIIGASAHTGTGGNEGGTIFRCGPNLPSTCSPITLAGTGNLFGRRLEYFSLLPSSAAKGTHAVFINAAGHPNYFEYNFNMRNVNIGNMLNGQSFKTFASPNVTVTANVTTTNMTITGASAGTIFPGAVVVGLSANTVVVSQTSGTSGGNGVYVINNSQSFSGSVTILGNNGGGALNNALIENSILMSVNMKLVGDSVTFRKCTIGQGETRGDPGYTWDQVSGATSVTVDDGIIANANGSVIINGGINPRLVGVEIESGVANTHGSMVDISGATSKVLGGSAIGCTVSQNYGTGDIYPFRVDTSENFSIGPNNRIATQSGGGIHAIFTSNAVNPWINGNYCTTGGTVADCLVSNSSSSINYTRFNIGRANGPDLLNVGGTATLSGLHMPNADNSFTFLPPPSGAGAFRFGVNTNVDMVSTGGAGQVFKQTSLGGPMTVATLAFSEITGSVAAAQLPNPSATTLGGVKSLAAVSHNFLTSISTAGAPTQAQPAFTDISGSVAASQMPAFTGDVTTVAGAVANTLATVNANVGSFGDATHAGAFTVNAKGLITSAASTAITGTPPGGAAGGLLAGTYPNPTLAIPYFLATMTADQTVTSGAFAIVSFATKVLDSNTWYDAVTNFRFTPLLAGKYMVTVQVTGSGTTLSAVTAAIAKNGTSIISGSGVNTTVSNLQGNMVTMIVSMNGSTDFLEAGVIVTGTGTCKVLQNNPSIGQTGSWFQAHFIAP